MRFAPAVYCQGLTRQADVVHTCMLQSLPPQQDVCTAEDEVILPRVLKWEGERDAFTQLVLVIKVHQEFLFSIISTCLFVCVLFVDWCVCHSAHVEVGDQLVGVSSSLLLCRPWAWTRWSGLAGGFWASQCSPGWPTAHWSTQLVS